MKIIILGSGIIGVTTAYFLARDGHEVVVVDKNEASALGCSYANGGQLSYSHIEPWASKDALLSVVKSKFGLVDFIDISKFFSFEILGWSYSFAQNARLKNNERNSKNLFNIALKSRESFLQILEEEGADLRFDYKSEGILHFYRTQKALNEAIEKSKFHASFGCHSEVLNARECLRKEPTLQRLSDQNKLAGGIFYKIDASGNSFLFAQSLVEICRKKYGVKFEYGAKITNILTNRKVVTGICTDRGVFKGDAYVSCLGGYGQNILEESLALSTKIYPLKGYSLSIPANNDLIAPNLSLTDPQNKVVYSRVGNIFRAAGTVEMCDFKTNKNAKLLGFLKDNIISSFSDFGDLNKAKEWYGFRPFRPSSLPLICKVNKYGNFYINSGHGSLGWTLGAGSAKILSDMVLGKKDQRFSFLQEEEKSIYIK